MNFEAQLSVAESELEKQYRHLHHADICRLLEKGRLLFLDEIGCPQDELIAQDCFLVLTRMNLEFLREIQAGELTMSCSGSISPGGEIKIEQKLYKSPRRLCVRATFSLVCIGGETRRRRELPEKLRAALSADCN